MSLRIFETTFPEALARYTTTTGNRVPTPLQLDGLMQLRSHPQEASEPTLSSWVEGALLSPPSLLWTGTQVGMGEPRDNTQGQAQSRAAHPPCTATREKTNSIFLDRVFLGFLVTDHALLRFTKDLRQHIRNTGK